MCFSISSSPPVDIFNEELLFAIALPSSVAFFLDRLSIINCLLPSRFLVRPKAIDLDVPPAPMIIILSVPLIRT